MTERSIFLEVARSELEQAFNSPREARQFCLKYEVSMTDLYSEGAVLLEEPEQEQIEDPITTIKRVRKKTKRRAKKVIKKPKGAKALVISHLEELRARSNPGEQQDFESFLKLIDLDVTNNNIPVNIRGDLRGYVTSTLYEIATEKKFPGQAYARQQRLLRDPVTADDLEGLLIGRSRRKKSLIGVNFGEAVSREVCGILSQEFVGKHYVFDEGVIKGVDKKGKFFDNPNIEGVQSWDRKEKTKIRKSLADFVLKNVIAKREEQRTQYKERADAIQAEIEEARSIALSAQEKMDKIKDRYITYTVHGEPYFIDIFAKQVLGSKRSDQIREIEESTPKDNPKKRQIKVTFDTMAQGGKNPARDFVEKYRAFREQLSAKGQESNVTGLVPSVEQICSANNNQREGLKRKIDRTEKRIEEMYEEKEKLDARAKKPIDFRYMGLEGPNFGSFLSLAAALQEEDHPVEIRGIFPEYEQRSSNLMNSLISGLRGKDGNRPEAFQHAQSTFRNIDEWILLDFVKDQEMKVTSDNGTRVVSFLKETIPLETYTSIIDEVDANTANGASKRENINMLHDHYGIGVQFAASICDRYEGKFDTAFLDYFGRITDRKSLVLERLVKKRLADNSVIALTVNAAPRMRQSGDVDEVSSELFDTACESLFNDSGFKGPDFIQTSYKDGGDPMIFHAYYLTRENN